MREREQGGRRFLYDQEKHETLEFNFGKLAELAERRSDDPRVQILSRFVLTIFQERNERLPEPEENIALRHADDIAVAAMFGIEFPDVTAKTMAYVEELGVTPDRSSE